MGSGWIFGGLPSQPLHQFHEETESQRSERSCPRSLQTAPSGSWASAVQGACLDLSFLTSRIRLQAGTKPHDHKQIELVLVHDFQWILLNQFYLLLSRWLNYTGKMGMCATEEGFSQGLSFSDPPPCFLSLQEPSDSITLLSSLIPKDAQWRNKGLHFVSPHTLKTLPYC